MIPISFEFFPPQTPEGINNLRHTRDALMAVSPEFFSITHGAGGALRDKTLIAIEEVFIKEITDKSTPKMNTPAIVPHLSCMGASKDDILGLLSQYKALGINRLVALRGDLPSGAMGGSGVFRHAKDLVRFIREQTGDYFHITVAAYPEKHPEADSLKKDINHFVGKAKEGAQQAITQFFFNADAYGYFVDAVRKEGVDIPIIPGIMPINKFSQLHRFSQQCGAEIPRWLASAMQDKDEASQVLLGVDVVTGLCENLMRMGAPSLHFYTLNRPTLSLEIINRLGRYKS